MNVYFEKPKDIPCPICLRSKRGYELMNIAQFDKYDYELCWPCNNDMQKLKDAVKP